MAQIFQLYRLQQLDTQIDQTETRLAEIVGLLENDPSVAIAKSAWEAARTEHHKTTHAVREAEELVRAQRLKIEHNQNALYGGKVRSPKELQDLQTEAGALQRRLASLEDELLERMMEQETTGETLDQQTQNLSEVEKQAATYHIALTEEQLRLDQQLLRLRTERAAALPGIASDELELYEGLRRRRKGIAISVVKDGACGVCGSMLNASDLQSARSPLRITRCSDCGRILFSA